MTEANDLFVAERKHWNDLIKKYSVWCGRGESEELWLGDTERVIKCLMIYRQETEEQVIARLEASDIDNPVTMNDEVFWLERS